MTRYMEAVNKLLEEGKLKENSTINLNGVGFYFNYGTNIVRDNEIPTLTTRNGIAVVWRDIMNKIRIRKLTPKECWRLMGFSDEDYEKAAKVNSNTQLYKQAGNSIAVPILKGILTNLLINNPK